MTTTLSTTLSVAGTTLKPHKFQLDVTYFRDRFTGADTQVAGRPSTASQFGFQGQKFDSVLLMAIDVQFCF